MDAPLNEAPQSSTAVTLLQQALTSSDLTLITAAVLEWQRVLQLTPDDHPSRAGYLTNLSSALQIRFEQTGEPADLDEAIRLGQAAVAASLDGHPDLAAMVSSLGNALQVRFERAGAGVDLTEAIRLYGAAVVATPADHPNQALYLSNLATALQARFGHTGTQEDLDKAIRMGRAAVAAALDNDRYRAMYLSNLGNMLRIRFEEAGARADLDEAIQVGRAAVTATSADHPKLAMYLTNLGNALQARFEHAGAQEDLDQAIHVGRAAVAATPESHPNRALRLSNLGNALKARFVRVGAQSDLDEAIRVGRAAVAATPADHINLAMYLSNVAGALQVRFERTAAQADLDEAITVGRKAVSATPESHPQQGKYLSNLGGALRARFERTGAPEDLDEAITMGQAAVAATPDDHPGRVGRLSNLGNALLTRFRRDGVQADLDEAITTYSRAAGVESGPASSRIHAARKAASLCAQSNPTTAADLLENAVRLLPETAPRQLHRGDQQHALGQFAGLASDAAALALRSNMAGPHGENPATRALRLLELGRGVLLSQALDTRSDLTDLHARHPALAARFIELRDQLDQPNDPLISADDAGMSPEWGQRWIEDRHHLAAKFAATVAEIRRQEGFETFLLPPEPDQLLSHTKYGSIAVINVSQYHSDAILLTRDEITFIPLPKLTHNDLIDQINLFHHGLEITSSPHTSADQRKDAQHILSQVLEWLWEAVAQQILDELGYQHAPIPGAAWPRLWLVPGGLLGFLPLHAAGYHREPPGPNGARRTIMDRVISSYTPTIRALGHARERLTTSAAGNRALIVAMPTTPGNGSLEYVIDEAELVRTKFTDSILLIEDQAGIHGHSPTKAAVLANLGSCTIAHFACHGHSHPTDPSQSRLLLHDHDTNPLTVASLAPIRFEHARLAYLSACRTAFNSSTDLADESIHLTTAFQLVGYPHVVGTLWEIKDKFAVRIAKTFYTALTASSTHNTADPAQALHQAVRESRDARPTTPYLWATYLHAGA